ncbi:MAG: hypothetical protein H6621_12475 [Halobacteriovoraceae bacterium]|nr:hypothetical protein [Halobacteriovoraceae bacterium]
MHALIFTLIFSILYSCTEDRARARNVPVVGSAVVAKPEPEPLDPKEPEEPEVILGCQYEKAKNYNKFADKENGKCDFYGCNIEGYTEYDPDYFKNVVDPYMEKLRELGITYIGKTLDDVCMTIEGCTSPLARNYNALANKENGSCEFKGCPVVDNDLKMALEDYRSNYPDAPLVDTCSAYTGCTEALAYNYQPTKKIADNTCRFRACPILEPKVNTAYMNYKALFPNAADLEDTCADYTGCTEPKAYNYDATKQIADNTCRFKGCPQTDLSLKNAYQVYKSKFPNAAALEDTCDTLKGCLQPLAMNYEANKQIEDMSCKFRGCPILDANLKAAYENYKATYPNALPLDDTCENYRGCLSQYATNYDPGKVLPKGNCNFQWCGQENHEFTDMNFTQIVNNYLTGLQSQGISHTGSLNDSYNCGRKIGCTADQAENYDSLATLDSGACTFKGCPTVDYQLKMQYEDYIVNYPNATLENTCPAQKTEIFNQNNAPHVGILWIVDNSGSMADEQANLANNFTSFINTFVNKGIDFTMGITTTDSQHEASSVMLLNRQALESNQTSFIDNFKSLIRVGTYGSATERGFEGSYRFMQSLGYSSPSRGDGGLLKDNNSFFVAIYVSDESEQSANSVSFYLDNLRTYVNKASKFQAHAIINTSGSYGTRYISMVNSTGGRYASINSNFAGILTNIGDSLVELIDLFTLNTTPYESTIEVYVNGNRVYNWTYDASKNAIVFNTPPDYGEEVTVKYLPYQP